MQQFGYEESQAGESPVLRALLPDDPVIYVDVGAGEYMDWNTTWPFYKSGGYGLLVEPREEMWEDYNVHRRHDVVCTNAAYSRYDCLPMRLAGGSSTLRADWAIDEIMQGIRLVAVEPLYAMLARYLHIREECRFCSIDVEGVEREVLLGIDWNTFRPEVVMVEYVAFDRHGVGPDISAEWSPVVLDGGRYRECCRSWLNIIYIRSDLWDRWETIRPSVPLPHQTLDETRAHYRNAYGIET